VAPPAVDFGRTFDLSWHCCTAIWLGRVRRRDNCYIRDVALDSADGRRIVITVFAKAPLALEPVATDRAHL